MGEPLQIPIHLDKSPAEASAEAFRQSMRALQAGLVADAKAATQAEVATHKAGTNAKTVALKTMTEEGQKDIGKLRDELGRFRKGVDDLGDGYVASGKSGVASFMSVTQAIPGVLAGMGRVNALGKIWLDSIKESGDLLRKQGQSLLEKLEPQGRIAGLQNKNADISFVVKQAALRKRTLLTEDESLKAQEAFANSGAQFIGQGRGKLDQDEAQAAFERTAKLGVAKKFDPAAVADLTGRTMGMRDFSGLKKGEASQEIGRLVNQSMSVLEAGGGDAPRLVTEVNKIAGASVNEDSLKGSFRSPVDVAKLVSVLNETSPGQESESARAAMKALRSFDDKKAGPLLKRAKITHEDDVFSSLAKLAPMLEAEAKAGPKGTTIKDVIGKSFEDEQGRNAIAGLINKGVYGGMFDARDATAAANAAPGALDDQVASFRKSDRGVLRTQDAEASYNETIKGSRVAKINFLEREADNALDKTGKRDTSGMLALEKVIKLGSFGTIDPRANSRDARMKNQLLARMTPELREQYKDVSIPTNPEKRSDVFNRMIRDIEGTGRSAISDMMTAPGMEKPPAANAGRMPGQAGQVGMPNGEPGQGADPALTENNRLLAENNKLLAAQAGPPPTPNKAPATVPFIGAKPARNR